MAPVAQVRLNLDPGDPRSHRTIEIMGIPGAVLEALRGQDMTQERWGAVVQIYVDRGGPAAPMLGSYQVEDTLIRF